MQKRCNGCMKLKTESPVCEHCGFDENNQNASHQLPAGTVLREQYLVGKVLGQGGFGITYLGWDLYLSIPVAIKEYYPTGSVMRESSVSLGVTGYEGENGAVFAANRERFLREAQTLARLSNVPEVVQVRSFFLENNTAYIVMEYIQGTTLRDYVRLRGKLSPEETFAILRPIMNALTQVHNQGLVHRDISPDNIMLPPKGGVKLLDFGAVRDVGNAVAGQELPKSTVAILKHGFAPIEQYQRRGSLGPWTDVYALCATMYFCLTGKVPPDAPERLMDDMGLSWDGIPGLTKAQIAALEQGMALFAKERTGSMEALITALFAPAPKSEPEPKPAPQPKREPKPQPAPASKKKPTRRKKKGLPIFLAAVILLLAAAAGVYAIGSMGASSTGNLLMTDKVPDGEGAKYVLGSGYLRTRITSVTFLDSVSDAPEDCWDASATQDGSVLAWVSPSETYNRYYDLYIAGEGGVNGRNACAGLFQGYEFLREVNFNDSFYTAETTDMSHMFHGCINLAALDISGLDTSDVQNMSYMFAGCKNLTGLVTGRFDRSSVNNYSHFMESGGMVGEKPWMELFTGIPLTSSSNVLMADLLENKKVVGRVLGSEYNRSRIISVTFLNTTAEAPEDCWDVSAAGDGSVLAWVTPSETFNNYYDLYIAGEDGVSGEIACAGLFCGYNYLREVNFNGCFFTGKTTDMRYMFYGCINLRAVNLDELDTANAADVSHMFEGCSNLDLSAVAGWDLSSVKNYENFMDAEKTVSGESWEALFG